MAAQMETPNVMEKMRPLPFIVMFVVAAEFDILKESLRRRNGCSMSLHEL